MENFKQYRRKQIAELRPVTDEEVMSGNLDSKISISQADKDDGSPCIGDMVARNPKNHNDQWLVAKKYFEDNFEPIPDYPISIEDQKNDSIEKLKSLNIKENEGGRNY